MGEAVDRAVNESGFYAQGLIKSGLQTITEKPVTGTCEEMCFENRGAGISRDARWFE